MTRPLNTVFCVQYSLSLSSDPVFFNIMMVYSFVLSFWRSTFYSKLTCSWPHCNKSSLSEKSFFFYLLQMMESDDEDEGMEQEVSVEISKHELLSAVRSMSTKLEDLRTCNDLIAKHGHALQRSVGDLESAAGVKEAGDKKQPDMADIQSKVKILNERATLFKITSNAMINACAEYMELTQTQGWLVLITSHFFVQYWTVLAQGLVCCLVHSIE